MPIRCARVVATSAGTSVGSARKAPRNRTVPELYGEAETHVVPPAATDHRQVGVIEMEIAIKLLQGRGAVEAAVSPLLLDR